MDNFVGQSKLLGTLPVVYNVANFTQARAGRAGAAQLRRCDHDVPRVRPRAARHVCQTRSIRRLSGTNAAARFRRVPLAVQRALGELSGGLRSLREALQDGRADAGRAGREDQEGGNFNQGYDAAPNCWPRRNSTCSGTRCRRARRWKIPMRSKPRRWRRRISGFSDVPPRYRSSYFLHIWANGYAAGYYAYLWSEMLDDDAYQWFEDHGGLTRANGDRFRRWCCRAATPRIWRRCTRHGLARNPRSNRC